MKYPLGSRSLDLDLWPTKVKENLKPLTRVTPPGAVSRPWTQWLSTTPGCDGTRTPVSIASLSAQAQRTHTSPTGQSDLEAGKKKTNKQNKKRLLKQWFKVYHYRYNIFFLYISDPKIRWHTHTHTPVSAASLSILPQRYHKYLVGVSDIGAS